MGSQETQAELSYRLTALEAKLNSCNAPDILRAKKISLLKGHGYRYNFDNDCFFSEIENGDKEAIAVLDELTLREAEYGYNNYLFEILAPARKRLQLKAQVGQKPKL